jgi:hypothetical protein
MPIGVTVKDVTVFESSTSHVQIILNRREAFILRNRFDTLAETVFEAQTIHGVNFRSFEDICWRYGLSVADTR